MYLRKMRDKRCQNCTSKMTFNCNIILFTRTIFDSVKILKLAYIVYIFYNRCSKKWKKRKNLFICCKVKTKCLILRIIEFLKKLPELLKKYLISTNFRQKLLSFTRHYIQGSARVTFFTKSHFF